jgi:Xaa-Pro dipeptidase
MSTEQLPDPLEIRAARRARMYAAMQAHDLDILVLGRVANIRYASGVPILWNAGTRPFGPGCVVVRATEEIFVLSTWDEGVPDDIPHDHLFGITWNPMNMVKMLEGIGTRTQPERVGTDALSPLFANLLPMAFPDAEIVDASPALHEARRIKSPEEVEAIRATVAVADRAVAATVGAVRPDSSERELAAVFMDAMASQGVTTPATQDIVRITGELVVLKAGVVASGYIGEVGRTIRMPGAGPGNDRAIDDLFRRANDLWARLFEACRPGRPASGLLDAYHDAGEPVPTMPIGRGLGLGFDDPVITGALPRTAAQEILDPGVVMVVTTYVTDDSVGSIIMHEPVLITAAGPETLSVTPYFTAETTGAST